MTTKTRVVYRPKARQHTLRESIHEACDELATMPDAKGVVINFTDLRTGLVYDMRITRSAAHGKG